MKPFQYSISYKSLRGDFIGPFPKKYKTLQSLVDAGLVTEREKELLEEMARRTEDQYTLHWYPVQWAQTVLRKCYTEGHIGSPIIYDRLHQELLREGDKYFQKIL